MSLSLSLSPESDFRTLCLQASNSVTSDEPDANQRVLEYDAEELEFSTTQADLM